MMYKDLQSLNKKLNLGINTLKSLKKISMNLPHQKLDR